MSMYDVERFVKPIAETHDSGPRELTCVSDLDSIRNERNNAPGAADIRAAFRMSDMACRNIGCNDNRYGKCCAFRPCGAIMDQLP